MKETMVFDPIFSWQLWWLLGSLLLGFITYSSYTTSKSLHRRKQIFLLTMRAMVFCSIWFMTLRPSWRAPEKEYKSDKSFLIMLDDSLSMQQRDESEGSRWEKSINVLKESDLEAHLHRNGVSSERYSFSNEITHLTGRSLSKHHPEGEITNIYESLEKVLDTQAASLSGVLMISDGRDFSGVSAYKTAQLAKQRRVPIHTWAVGFKGKVRDASVHLNDIPPYTYQGQEALLKILVEQRGLEHEYSKVELYHEGTLIQSKDLSFSEEVSSIVSFRVQSDLLGQQKYTVKLVPLKGEVSLKNNEKTFFTNVVQEKIDVLILEGEPYWDTTFLQRSLMTNDKFNVDFMSYYAENRIKRVQKQVGYELKLPKSVSDYERYDIVILGKGLDNFMTRPAFEALESYVKQEGGVVIFARALADLHYSPSLQRLHPATLSEVGIARVSLKALAEGKHLNILEGRHKLESDPNVPRIIAARGVERTKNLVSVLANAVDGSGEKTSALLYRRYGTGQVLSFGVDGFWRWGFRENALAEDNEFHHFWDQLITWLIAGADAFLSESFSLQADLANIPIGESVQMRFKWDPPKLKNQKAELSIYKDGNPVYETVLSLADGLDRMKIPFTPEELGDYQVNLKLAGQNPLGLRFVVYNDDRERVEVQADASYLKKLSDSSGGLALTQMEDFESLLSTFESKGETETKYRLISLWDRFWVFILIALGFSAEWYCRRKWGLA